MAISRVTAIWTGFSGAPGYTSLFFDAFGAGDEVDLEVARVRNAFQALAPQLPTGVTIQVQQEAEILDEASGELLGYGLADEQPNAVNGSASGAYSAPTGAIVTWNTDTVARGRRLRGRTFLVPLSGNSYEGDGTLSASALTALNNFGSRMAGDGDGPQHVVWSRPRNGAGGSIGPVVSHRVPDMAAVLRSRRD